MESNNINRISATGLKSIEIDELTTDQIIINNEGLLGCLPRYSKTVTNSGPQTAQSPDYKPWGHLF